MLQDLLAQVVGHSDALDAVAGILREPDIKAVGRRGQADGQQ